MKTVLEYLNEKKDMAWHNRMCYSATCMMDKAKEGFETEFAGVVRDCEIVDELISIVNPNLPEYNNPQAELPGRYGEADNFLEPLLTAASEEHWKFPDSAEKRHTRDMLLFLANLNRKEGQVAKASHTDKLMELARILETDYAEFRIKEIKTKDIVFAVYTALTHKYVGEITFRKMSHSFIFKSCNFF